MRMNLLDLVSGEFKPLTYKTRSILVINSKGGCGKTTLATNLASYYATKGSTVTLADFDPQGSSLAWLEARPDNKPPIHGLAAWRDPQWVPQSTDVVIMDMPAGIHGKQMARLMRRAQTVIVPVLPSPLDMRAAADFIWALLTEHTRARLPSKLAVMANRVRENSRAYDSLDSFLHELKLPVVASLRDNQNYLVAAERGLGIFELGTAAAAADIAQWEPLLKWLKSKKSMPKVA
jgi:chromosome partitioning protein